MREQHEKHPSNAALVLCSVGMAVTNTSRWHILACSKAGRSSSFGSMMALLTRVLLSALSSCPPLSSGLSCSVSLLATILHLPQQHGWPLALAPLAAPADPSVAICSVFLPSMLMLPAVLAFTPRNNPPPAARQPSTRAATTLQRYPSAARSAAWASPRAQTLWCRCGCGCSRCAQQRWAACCRQTFPAGARACPAFIM